MAQLLIHNRKVLQVETKRFPVHKDLKWVTGIGKPGDRYVDGKVIPYIEPVVVKTWRQNREENYPRVREQLDIYYKEFKALAASGQVTLQPETIELLDSIDEIKSTYPKPTE